jgi:hypothetical protein
MLKFRQHTSISDHNLKELNFNAQSNEHYNYFFEFSRRMAITKSF